MHNRISNTFGRTLLASATLLAGAALATAPLHAQTLTVIYTFTGGADGGSPFGTPLLYNGNLYGTTRGGGANNSGVIYEANFASRHEAVLHAFAGGPTDGAGPIAGLIQDASGILYGVTYGGGANNFGTIFKLVLPPSGKYTVLHSFAGPPTEGAQPAGALAFDTSGNLFGTTYDGGANGPAKGWGSTFEYSSTGIFVTGQSFPPGGALPRGGLFRIGGAFYGTTTGGTPQAYGGTIFKDGAPMALYTFSGGADGAQPLAGVIGDSSGNLYGTCSGGGSAPFGLGYGVVFAFNISTSQLTVLHTFSGADGASPAARLFRDSSGNLYGTTMFGGASGNGTIFKIDTTGAFTSLYSFTGGADGGRPAAGVVVDSKGNIFGAASAGGASGAGTLYILAPPPAL